MAYTVLTILVLLIYGSATEAIKQPVLSGEQVQEDAQSDCIIVDGKQICKGGHKYFSDQESCSVVDEDGVCLNVPKPDADCDNVTLITRTDWTAEKSRTIERMKTPVSIVFIHHTAMDYCLTKKDCIGEVKNVQHLHMHHPQRKWDDVGYNFLVGEDGNIFEGRGWDRIGAHTKGFNKISVSIAAMGDFNHRAPNQLALDAIERIIACGVVMRKITPDYKLYGHRDASTQFDSPGHYLYAIIKGWKHYDVNGPHAP